MKKVLIVDDNRGLRELVRATLNAADYVFHEAGNGRDALDIVYDVRPELVILDVMMPGEMDGFDVCQEIKSRPDLSDTAVILLTARSQVIDVEQSVRVRADKFMSKPFSPLELMDVVEGLLQPSS